MRVLIADDHRLIVEGIKRALEESSDFEVVAEATSGSQVLPLVGRTNPDLVLLDLRMPGADGLTCLTQIRKRYPDIKVVVLSVSSDENVIQTALKRGASAYIVKSINPIDLPSALRQAVELLVAAFGRADAYARDRGQPGLAAVTAAEGYRGAVAVMMRVIFLLFAEESGLLPADSELYTRAYSVGSLAAELEQRVTDARGNEGELEHTYLAWHRLLALFTAVYRGVDHPDLDLIAHDGSLFDPGTHPWLEGRQPGQDSPGTPLAVDDRTVLHMLRAVQTVIIGGELRTVSFRTLTVEQIGYAYEGLLSYEGFRAAEVVVGLTGKDGQEDEVPLAELERLAAAHPGAEALAARLAEAHRDSGVGSPRNDFSRASAMERCIRTCRLGFSSSTSV